MPRLSLVAVIVVAVLAGCAEGNGVLGTAAERDAARCTAQGLEPDSAAHVACVERAAAYRERRRESRGLATPNVRCTAGGNAGGCF